MQLFESVVMFVVIFLTIVSLGIYLKHRKILTDDSTSTLSKLIMELVYPALIFATVATAELDYEEVVAAAAFDLALLSVGAVSYLVAKYLLKLDRKSLAAVVLAAMFSGTSLIGAAMLKIVFEGHPENVSIGIVVAQLSNALLLNSLGIFIGAHFGSDANAGLSKQIKDFLFSKPLIALALGLIWSLLNLPTTGILAGALIGSLAMIGAAMPLLAALVTGLTFKIPKVKGLTLAILLVVAGQLVLEPLFFFYWADRFGDSLTYKEIGVLMASLGSSPVVVVICNRYRCNTELASTLVLSTTLLSAVTLPISAYLVSSL